MKAVTKARIERHLRPWIVSLLPPKAVVEFYSTRRSAFIDQLVQELPEVPYIPPLSSGNILWGIPFQGSIMNAAGMFKNGEGYELCALQGAAGYLAGTTTANPRTGNPGKPFAPLPWSGSAMNFLGLPNDGDEVVAKRLGKIKRVQSCPVGISVMGSPDLAEQHKLRQLVHGMYEYVAVGGVDFIELNESCPNTGERPQDSGLYERLSFIAKSFTGISRVPVVVKFSNDTQLAQVASLVDMLVDLGYDGINFGNTGTEEKRFAPIHGFERELFDYFSKEYGVRISGRPLRMQSLLLCGAAADRLEKLKPDREFHVIRCGGVFTAKDIENSKLNGISMNQWFTGYFEGLSKHGHDVYRKVYD